MLKKIKLEISAHKFIYFTLSIILIAGFFIRVYRLPQILGFYFDQGRDALVIWDLIHSHKFFLIGPTTGLAGIFRGPYYYYLLAPFYWLGHGDPVWPSVFLGLTTVIAIGFIYYLGYKIQNRATGIIAVIIASFSFYIVLASRWLSNPTPMLLLSMVLVWAMLKVTEGHRWAWPVIALVSGLSLFNFGSSGEFFYLPAISIFFIWQWKNKPDNKNFIISVLLFTLTFAPLVLFDMKHDHILLYNFTSTFGESSFKKVTKFIFEERTKFYLDVFTNKIYESRGKYETYTLLAVAISFFFFLPKFFKNKGIKILLLLLISPIIGLYFYQGNYAVVYDYYMTGYYLIFILLFAIVLGRLWQFKVGKIFVIYFLYLFLTNNLNVIKYKLSDKADSPQSIAFINQKQAIDWIYQDVGNKDFNVDVYVPPVIPYAYDYLFKWYGGVLHGREPDPNRTKVLYTLYEIDPPHPERLNAWLARQKGIGKVQTTMHFGGITVERKERLNGKNN